MMTYPSGIVTYGQLADSSVKARPSVSTVFDTDGFFIAKNLLSDKDIAPYYQLRSQVKDPGGWLYEVPYLHYREVRGLCLHPNIQIVAAGLVGEQVGLHLNLTGWVSTERDWHSDSYLNPEGVDDWYVAAWIALENIDPDSGPFQCFRGSHRWPVLRREKLFNFLTPEQRGPSWPSDTQDMVAKACLQEAVERGGELVTPQLKKGDVLFWHSFLLHRGSPPNRRGTPRRACIAHYSGINHRPDMQFVEDPYTTGYMAEFNRPWPSDRGYPEPTT